MPLFVKPGILVVGCYMMLVIWFEKVVTWDVCKNITHPDSTVSVIVERESLQLERMFTFAVEEKDYEEDDGASQAPQIIHFGFPKTSNSRPAKTRHRNIQKTTHLLNRAEKDRWVFGCC